MQFTIATYNIHKGFSHLTLRMVIHELKEKLHGLSPDLVFLQEVLGAHHRHAGRYHDWPGKPQHEFIADTMWREVAYGRNAVYRHGHHGNAVLSRYPIVGHENEDISAHAAPRSSSSRTCWRTCYTRSSIRVCGMSRQ